jgi:hypothetical protein
MPRIAHNKLSVEAIEFRIEKVHGDVVRMDKATYKGTNSEARFIDKDFGEWWAIVASVTKGHGHKLRGIQKVRNKIKFSMPEIKERILKIHNDLVILDESTYGGLYEDAKFIDKDFGEWWTKPANVLCHEHGHPDRGKQKSIDSRRLSIQEVLLRLKEVHGDEVELLESTYIDFKTRCIFIDKDLGEFPATPRAVIQQHTGHPDKWREKQKKTLLDRYGVDSPLKNKEILEKALNTNEIRYGVRHATQNAGIALKAAKKSNNKHVKYHWKTNEELVCQASWEAKVVDYLNAKQISFDWQPKTFKMPTGKTYRPDLYLVEQDVWVEIKGWMRPEAKIKWDWFKTEYPTAELWDKKKLKEMGIL